MRVYLEEGAEGGVRPHVNSIHDLLEILVQLDSPVLDVLVILEGGPSLGREEGHIRMATLHGSVELAEIVVAFHHLPLLTAGFDKHWVEDHLLAVDVDPLKVG